jgi:hypothetical protein
MTLDLFYRETLIRVEAKAVTDELGYRTDILDSVVSQRILDANWV